MTWCLHEQPILLKRKGSVRLAWLVWGKLITCILPWVKTRTYTRTCTRKQIQTSWTGDAAFKACSSHCVNIHSLANWVGGSVTLGRHGNEFKPNIHQRNIKGITHTRKHTCTHTCTHTHTHKHTHKHTHANTHAHTHTQTHMHTHAHTHAHTHVHTHMHHRHYSTDTQEYSHSCTQSMHHRQGSTGMQPHTHPNIAHWLTAPKGVSAVGAHTLPATKSRIKSIIGPQACVVTVYIFYSEHCLHALSTACIFGWLVNLAM